MGIGSPLNSLVAELMNYQNPGLHTELFADGCLEPIEKGIINGACRKIDKGQMVASFLLGSQKVYEHIDHNDKVQMRDIKYTNDP